MYIAIMGLACVAILYLLYLLNKERKKLIQVITINEEVEEYNNKLLLNKKILELKYTEVNQLYEAKAEALARLTSSVELTSLLQEAIARKRAEEEYERKTSALDKEYQEKREQLEEETRQSLLDYKLVKGQVDDLKAKLLAYILMKLREEEMEAKLDYYRLIIPELELLDVKFLREVLLHLLHKDAIDRIIWDSYYKPAYDVLMTHLFLNQKVCGIYRITCISTDKAYIGQSVKYRPVKHFSWLLPGVA